MYRNTILIIVCSFIVLHGSSCGKEEKSPEPTPEGAKPCSLELLEMEGKYSMYSMPVYWDQGRISGYANYRFVYEGHMLLIVHSASAYIHDTLILDDRLHILERRKTEEIDGTGQGMNDPIRTVQKFTYDQDGMLSRRVWESYAYIGTNNFVKTQSDTTHYTFQQGDLIRMTQGRFPAYEITHYEYYQDTVPKEYISYRQMQEGGSAFTYRNAHFVKSASTNNGNYVVDYQYEKDQEGRIIVATLTTRSQQGSVNVFKERYSYSCK